MVGFSVGVMAMFEQQGHQVRETGRRWWTAVVMFAVVFAVAMAAIIGERLSDEALAVLAGAVCGVSAALPTSLLIVFVSRRRDEQRAGGGQSVAGVYPPVVVIAPPGVQSSLPTSADRMMYYPQSWPGQRHFTVVGGTGTGETDVAY